MSASTTSARALFHRRERLPDPAARRGGREVPRRRRAGRDALREAPLPGDDEGRRHVASRAGDRQRPRHRHVELFQSHPRSESGRALGPRRARRRAGRAERGAASARSRFAPDISTASRATVGGMMANNSAGRDRCSTARPSITCSSSRSCCRMDRWRTSAADRCEVDEICGRDSLEGACYREVRQTVRASVDEIERRYPNVLRRVGGYNLDALVAACAPTAPRLQHGEADRRLRRHARRRPRGEAGAGALPEPRPCWRFSSPICSRRSRRRRRFSRIARRRSR